MQFVEPTAYVGGKCDDQHANAREDFVSPLVLLIALSRYLGLRKQHLSLPEIFFLQCVHHGFSRPHEGILFRFACSDLHLVFSPHVFSLHGVGARLTRLILIGRRRGGRLGLRYGRMQGSRFGEHPHGITTLCVEYVSILIALDQECITATPLSSFSSVPSSTPCIETATSSAATARLLTAITKILWISCLQHFDHIRELGTEGGRTLVLGVPDPFALPADFHPATRGSVEDVY